MSNSVLLSFSLLSAITLGLVYQPIFSKLSVGLLTPYAKAEVKKRLFAATIDVLLVATVLVPYRSSGSTVYVYAAAAYLLLRDALAGRSVGKFVCGLVVINLKTGLPGGFRASASRNVLFLLPGANLVGAFLEAGTITRDPQGQRLGDRFALTQVVEGFGARDVVAAVQEWWLVFIAHLDRNSGKPRRAPVRLPR